MSIEPDGQAPYAPTGQVVAVIERYRDRGLQTPFTIELLTRIGVTEALAPRTLRTFKSLGLIDDEGQPSPEFEQLRKASGEDYKPRFAAIVRAAYEAVFNLVDPTNDPPERVRDAFRHFEPHGQQARMVSLFLGLCEYTGIIEKASKRPRVQTQPQPGRVVRRQRSRPVESAGEPALVPPAQPIPPIPPIAPNAHPFLVGMLQALPPIPPDWPTTKTAFPEAEREAWINAARANFSLLYELPTGRDPGGDDG